VCEVRGVRRKSNEKKTGERVKKLTQIEEEGERESKGNGATQRQREMKGRERENQLPGAVGTTKPLVVFSPQWDTPMLQKGLQITSQHKRFT
jgi:hypothetical protein